MTWQPIRVEPFISDSDLSAKRGYIVKGTTTADHCTIPTGATDKPLGVLMFNTAAGTGLVASVMTLGIAECVVDGNASSIAVGDEIGTNNAGKGVKKSTDHDWSIGTAMDASTVDGDIIRVRVNGPRTLSV